MAEMRYLELKAEVDQSSADVVIALINAIGEVTFTDESKAIIDGAKEAYENLTTEQKALVSNYDTLTTAETKYSELKRNAESQPSAGEQPSGGNQSSGGSQASSEGSQNVTKTSSTRTQQSTVVKEPITIKKTPASVKAKAKKNKVTVSWKKIKKTKKTRKLLAQIKGIQVQYSNDPKFEQVAVTKIKNVGKKKTKITLKLKRKATYYIRVRYVGADGVSKWSKVKKVKTK